VREISPIDDYAIPVIEGTLVGAAIGAFFPISFPGIVLYQFMKYGCRDTRQHR
jgi:hypothetical protein